MVSAHAGFIYCGDIVGAVYSKIEVPETVILLGPNHTGLGENISVMTEGPWAIFLSMKCEQPNYAKKLL